MSTGSNALKMSYPISRFDSNEYVSFLHLRFRYFHLVINFHQTHNLDLDEITAVLRTRRLRWYGTYSVPLRASTPSRDWGFQAPEIVGGQGRRGPHVSEMI